MAIRLNASSEGLRRTTNLPQIESTYTFAMWVNCTSGGAASHYSVLFSLDQGTATRYDELFFFNSAGNLRLGLAIDVGSYIENVGTTNLATGTWYYVALVRAAINDIKAYRFSAGSMVQDASVTNSQTSTTETELIIGYHGSYVNDYYDGRIMGVKIWTAALTTTELLQEVYRLTPARTANLNCWSPCFPGSGERTRDYSGNGNSWTEMGTLTEEESAPIGWQSAVQIVIPWVVAESGTTLVVQDSSHAHSAENVSLTQIHSLVAQESSHTHSAESPSLIQTYTLSVEQASHAHAAENASLTQVYTLTPQEALHSHSAESPTNTQVYTVAVQESLHSHAADASSLTQLWVVVPQESLHSHSADATLAVVALTVQSSTHVISNESYTEYKDRIKTLFGSSLLAYWPLDETSGSVVNDYSGNNYTGTYHSVQLASDAGHVAGQSVPYFNGVGGYVDVFSTALRDAWPTGTATIFAWVLGPTVWNGGTYCVMHFSDSSNTNYAVFQASSYNLQWGIRLGGHNTGFIDNSSSGTATWILGGCGWNDASDLASWYKNDAQIGTSLAVTGSWNASLTYADIGDTSYPLRMSYWKGWISDVTLINRLPTASEVRAFYTYDLTLTHVAVLQVQECSHAHAAESPSLIQTYTLAVDEALHSHSAQNATVSLEVTLVVTESLHGHTADNTTLSQFTFLRPSADAYVGGWTTDTGATTNLYEAINEVTAIDTDYIQSELNPVSSPVALQLSSGSDPFSSSDHVFYYRYMKDGGGTIDLTVELRQDYVNESNQGTLIAQWVHAGIDTITTTEQTLSAAQADSITDYSALFVRMVANKV